MKQLENNREFKNKHQTTNDVDSRGGDGDSAQHRQTTRGSFSITIDLESGNVGMSSWGGGERN